MMKYRLCLGQMVRLSGVDIMRVRACGHAEIMIEEANQRENSRRLLDTTLFVTIEPPVSCMPRSGSRIPR